MQTVTATIGSSGGVALASRVFSWLESSNHVSLSHLIWRLDPMSLLIGLMVVTFFVLAIEAWFIAKWVVISWSERSGSIPVPRPRGLPKPLYKLC